MYERLGLAVPLLVILCLLPLGYAGAINGGLEDVSTSAGLYAELRTEANRWIHAVRTRHEGVLISLALPEARAQIRSELRSRDSALHQLLFSGPYALRGRFKNIETPAVTLLRHAELVDAGNGTTVCFCDPEKPPERTPRTSNELPNPISTSPYFCLFFFRVEQQWYTSYGFAEDAGS